MPESYFLTHSAFPRNASKALLKFHFFNSMITVDLLSILEYDKQTHLYQPLILLTITGEHHYFEAVQCLRSLDHHYFENRLALCPTCAAMYLYARETDDANIRKLIVESDRSETVSSAEIPIKLANRQFQLRFVGTHIFDLKSSERVFTELLPDL